MDKRPVVPEDLLRIISVADPQIRPDGSAIAFTRKHIGGKYKTHVHLWLVDMEGAARALTAGEHKNQSPRWSPDGRRIAFLSDRQKPGTQIFVLDLGGGEAQPLTKLPEGAFDGFRWSPDGRYIAFSFRESDPDFTEEGAKRMKDEGRSTPPRITEKGFYRLDGDGYFMERRHAVFVVDAATGDCRKVFDGCPVARYAFDWSPDSSRLAITYSQTTEPWREPSNDQIALVGLGGERKDVPNQGPGEKWCLRWGRSGELAFFANDDPDDHRHIRNPVLRVIDPDSGAVKFESQGDVNFNTYTISDTAEAAGDFLEWGAKGDRLFTQVGHRGEAQLGIVSRSGHVELATSGSHALTFGSVAGGKVACLHSTPVRLNEVAVFQSGEVHRLTTFNDGFSDTLELAQPEPFDIEAADGYPVHGWVLRPPKDRANGAGVLEIHGGPQTQYGWCYFHEFQVLVSAGYTVVYSNPRGSTGYGSAHIAAIAGSWGEADWRDIEAVTQWMQTLEGIDSSRVGVMGGSYGGYMVNWVVGHTDAFRAAITDRCVSNLVAKSLNSDYPYYPGTYWKGAAYGDLESIADLWKGSPIAYFDRVKTPMLIIHSEGDLRCNIEQGEEVFTALIERGVPARFVRYPITTSHGMSRAGPPDLRLHRLHEILAWWRRWLSAPSA